MSLMKAPVLRMLKASDLIKVFPRSEARLVVSMPLMGGYWVIN